MRVRVYFALEKVDLIGLLQNIDIQLNKILRCMNKI